MVSWGSQHVCRVKSALMTACNDVRTTVQGSFTSVVFQNTVQRAIARWNDDGGMWWEVCAGRVDSQRRTLGRDFHRFVNAYLAALLSSRDETDAMSSEVEDIIAGLQASVRDGKVPMSAIIRSFADCPGDVFIHTLEILNWAGHIGAFTTLTHYKLAHVTVVKMFIAQAGRRSGRVMSEVCTTPVVFAVVFVCCPRMVPACVPGTCFGSQQLGTTPHVML